MKLHAIAGGVVLRKKKGKEENDFPSNFTFKQIYVVIRHISSKFV
jgi:hypothetical protein